MTRPEARPWDISKGKSPSSPALAAESDEPRRFCSPKKARASSSTTSARSATEREARGGGRKRRAGHSSSGRPGGQLHRIGYLEAGSGSHHSGRRRHLRRLDILANNAGILRDKSLRKMTDEMWQAVIDVHLRGTFLCTQAAAKHLVRQSEGGRIINDERLGDARELGQANTPPPKPVFTA